jgi:hypothetical protein
VIRTVYLAGPYSDAPEPNVKAALIVAEQVVRLGLYPFIPHLFHYWDQMFAHPYQFWMDMDEVWIKKCDALLLYAESPGAIRDAEVAWEHNIPVFHSVQHLASTVLKVGRSS